MSLDRQVGRAAARERQRRKRRRDRERKLRDEIEVRIVVSRQVRDVLTDAKWLAEWSEDDPRSVQEAVQNYVDGAHVTRDEFR